MKKTAILVVDLVRDFTRPEGTIYYETTGAMMPRVVEFLNQARARGALIVYIQHVMSREEAQRVSPDLKLRLCCVEGSGGELLDERLPVRPEDPIVRKSRFSGFFRTELEALLEERGVENVAVIGTKTNCCVRATATDASMRDYRTFLISDCVSTNTEELNRLHCADIGKYTAKVLTAGEFLSCWDNGGL